MTTPSVDETTLSSTAEPISIPPTQEAVDKRPSLEPETSEESLPPPPLSQASRRESNITEIDPNAFKITILSAASGYRTHISVNRELLEKAASSVEGDGFLVSQLKNAIWRDWPSDWPDALPPSPNFLRLIYAGKLLPDKSTLAECNIGPGKPNIVHLSVRPADFVDDEFESGKKIPGIPRRTNGSGCCNCTIS